MKPVNVSLSPQQEKVLTLVAHGRSSKQIAKDLDLAKCVVDEYVRNILDRLGAKNRTNAVALAMARQLIKFDINMAN
jgi:DNA-binding NarL/FixJ family response regulator